MWVKICGIRDSATARSVCEARADAIGLNFYSPSPRCVERAVAREIAQKFGESLEIIGLFVNHSLDEVLATVDESGLQTVQLHGDETPEFLAELASRRPDLRLLRAFRIDESGCGVIAEYLAECDRLNVKLAGCLVDSHVAGEYGGTDCAPGSGRSCQYRVATLQLLRSRLHPANIAEAIALRPFRSRRSPAASNQLEASKTTGISFASSSHA